MSATHEIEFVGKKARPHDNPYATFTGTMFGGPATYHVLKKYANDDAKPYARWMVAASTPATYGGFDFGDMYVADIVAGLSLSLVDGETPTTADLDAIAGLRGHIAATGAEGHTNARTLDEFTLNDSLLRDEEVSK